MIDIQTILCPIDFSDHSRRALDHAVAIARWYDSTITVFHVYPVPPLAAYGLEPPPAVGMALTPVDRERLTTALNYAMSLAQEADAHLTVLHVMTHETELTPEMSESLMAYGHLSATDFRRACDENARARLSAAVPEAVRAYCTVDTVLATGKPYREILRVAAEQQVHLIVMGVQGRGAVDLMFFGSTTQHVVRQAVCPVLTLRNP